MHLVEPKQMEEKLLTIANHVGAHMRHGNVQHVPRVVQGVNN